MAKFYITTTLPYVNADPHLGFALEIIQADFIARYRRLIGEEVIFNTGTDEHGAKIYRKAQESDKDPQKYVDEYAAKFDKLKGALNLSYTNFIRTTDLNHKKAAQEFWRRCLANEDIEKGTYQIKYCVGCELEKTESELEDGKCILHPNLKLEIREEENYFFKWSKYKEPLLNFYKNNPHFVVPEFRFNEIKQFVEDGLHDFSISRLKEKMPWGVAVPGDPNQVMYVWFDALVNYISTLGWPDDEKKFNEFWPGVQIAGKDNLKQQSAMWQAMLMSAGLPNSKQIIIHGFINSGGQKMSKSLGNVINPYEVVKKYGIDALRYWVGAKVSPFEDSDFTWEKFHDAYNADLANGLGNLVSRVAKLCENANYTEMGSQDRSSMHIMQVEEFASALNTYRFNDALSFVWQKIAQADKFINDEKPWELIKSGNSRTKAVLAHLVDQLQEIAILLEPFLPETAKKIEEQFRGPEIKAQKPLFPRINYD